MSQKTLSFRAEKRSSKDSIKQSKDQSVQSQSKANAAKSQQFTVRRVPSPPQSIDQSNYQTIIQSISQKYAAEIEHIKANQTVNQTTQSISRTSSNQSLNQTNSQSINDCELLLRAFDVDPKYGPSGGVLTRRKRYTRALKYGLNPPAYVNDILDAIYPINQSINQFESPDDERAKKIKFDSGVDAFSIWTNPAQRVLQVEGLAD